MDGMLIVNKPAGYTSRDIVNIIGKVYSTKKVGHTGTLDPLATGVLLICVNKATKVVELITSYDKEYIAEFEFGTLTDTLDSLGTILKDTECILKEKAIKDAISARVGPYMQEVPLYSAVKVNGKKLYEYARQKEKIELPKHKVDIKSLELLELRYERNKTIAKIKCNVSKGTYIRSLGNDIATNMGTNAIMISLVRTKQGDFKLEDALNLDKISIETHLIEISTLLNKYKNIIVDFETEIQIKNGILFDNIYEDEIILFSNKDNIPLALYKTYEKDTSKIKPWKTFFTIE